ncbi:hypothetical protein LEP1GSC105_4355 [Leptospira interrogans str. UI 12758]|uniref:Uncharacterized protein n=1 Tax=Leptospira interrogans str. UI 12758 TaxID=1049938 RepID=A0A0E2D984_LEPIR|nr:hypothetical protein LEP1GSC105_4355 [Leptospira interrogans str. UI 12758]
MNSKSVGTTANLNFTVKFTKIQILCKKPRSVKMSPYFKKIF